MRQAFAARRIRGAVNTRTPHRWITVLSLGVCVALGAPAGSLAYGWPVKPFDAPHPVRGSFGDPRTIFEGPPTRQTLLRGSGRFSFHWGVDISAPNGAAVYPVVSGVVTGTSTSSVSVASGPGLAFEYWHISPTVETGQRVQARRTVLGRILRPSHHVHLAELHSRTVVNPLQPGHLTPYRDTTVPVVANVSFRRSGSAIEIVASAYDRPAIAAPGGWRDLPVTPALLTWRITSAATGKVVVRRHVAYDVRSGLPTQPFWRIYARGTHQNMTVFGTHYSYGEPGVYLFRLTPEGFDMHALPDGVYALTVTAVDVGGNHSSTVRAFTVAHDL